MIIRMATPEDAPDVLAIYSPYIRDTAVTFEVKAPSNAEYARKIEKILGRFPYLVAEHNGKVRAYAYASPSGEHAAYQWNAELLVYVNGDYQHRGLGSRLYNVLIELLGLLGYRNLYALITLPNEGSISMHQRLGFTPLAVHKNAGYKLGRRHNVAWLEKNLGPYRPEPDAPILMKKLAPEQLRRVLENT